MNPLFLHLVFSPKVLLGLFYRKKRKLGPLFWPYTWPLFWILPALIILILATTLIFMLVDVTWKKHWKQMQKYFVLWYYSVKVSILFSPFHIKLAFFILHFHILQNKKSDSKSSFFQKIIQKDFFFSGIFVTLSRILFPICTKKQKHRTMSTVCSRKSFIFWCKTGEYTEF